MALSGPSYFYMSFMKSREISKIMCSYLQKAKYTSNMSLTQYEENNALLVSTENLSTISPYFPKAFNLAAYVNNSETLKNLVNLNVNLSKIEKKPDVVNKILKLDFEKDMKTHIIFISNFVGMEDVGNFITKNPMILCQPLPDLEVRVHYLKFKAFNDDQIRRIISANPFWLMFSTIRIDRRFGYFQQSLCLNGDEVRYLATKQPKLITYNLHHVKTNMFVIKEEMGFKDNEIKNIVLNKPKLLMLNQRNLFERFNYIHNVMQISHETILKYPEILLCRQFKVKQRHLFLEKLGRSQYDPIKENFVPIKSLVEDTDIEFCRKFAKCNVHDFNLFLKTL